MRKEKKKAKVIISAVILLSVTLLAVKVFMSLRNSFFRIVERPIFVLTTGSLDVFVFSFQGKEGLFLNFAKKEPVSATRGFGAYELGKIYSLGELDKKGGELLSETMQNNFYMPIFGYFYDKSGYDYKKASVKEGIFYIFKQSLKGAIKTNLNKTDLLILLWRSRKIDGSMTKTREYQGEIADFFKDRNLRKESLAIEVLNSTGHFGLAQKVSFLLENAGARVVRNADADEKIEKCLLIYRSDCLGKYSLLWLAETFGCDQQFNPDAGRADVSLIIGEQYWQMLNEKW